MADFPGFLGGRSWYEGPRRNSSTSPPTPKSPVFEGISLNPEDVHRSGLETLAERNKFATKAVRIRAVKTNFAACQPPPRRPGRGTRGSIAVNRAASRQPPATRSPPGSVRRPHRTSPAPLGKRND